MNNNKKLIQLLSLLMLIGFQYAQAQTRTEKDLLGEKQIPFDVATPIRNPVYEPGPALTATASRSATLK